MASNPDIAPLIDIMARLRAPVGGCDWDIEQSFKTIAPYTIEEAYEVADAIARNDMHALQDELGDLLLQVVFHSRIAEEAGHFVIADVIAGICAKMERRHPHIFGDHTTRPDWETLKAEERSAKDERGAFSGIALGLPALMRAEKLQKRAARVGFDWPNSEGPKAKIFEELAEVEAAACDADRAEEIGDLLFSVVNYARHFGVDSEAALRAANAKFERRFSAVETASATPLTALNSDHLELLWAAAKAAESNLR